MRTKFLTANEAYNYFLNEIRSVGIDFAGTRALFNVGFTIIDPLANRIQNEERQWNLKYAEAEWQWYLSGDPNIKALGDIYGKVPEIWKRMADDKGCVNSNYGYQWQRSDQLRKVVADLKENPETRQAAISIYDAKEKAAYQHDTPCTYAIQFTIVNNRLDMCVTMRSNDLWYGFCNDQYCFSELQRYVAMRIDKEVGEYYHFAHNLHLYNNKL